MGTILLTGATGLLGSYWIKHSTYTSSNNNVISVSRRKQASKHVRVWDPTAPLDDDFLQNIDAVVHLAGAPIAKKLFSKGVKQRLWNSRVHTTELLVRAMQKHRPRVFICASAIGYYGGTATDACTESSPPGTDFLSTLTQAWEAAAQQATVLGVRVVQLRFGHILSTQGGLLAPLLWAQRYGLGTVFGTGEQMMSWVHIADVARLMDTILQEESYQGPLNVTAPQPITLSQFVTILARKMGKRLWLPAVPAWLLRAILGEMSSLFLEGNAVLPKRAQQLGYEFLFDTFDVAIDDLLNQTK